MSAGKVTSGDWHQPLWVSMLGAYLAAVVTFLLYMLFLRAVGLLARAPLVGAITFDGLWALIQSVPVGIFSGIVLWYKQERALIPVIVLNTMIYVGLFGGSVYYLNSRPDLQKLIPFFLPMIFLGPLIGVAIYNSRRVCRYAKENIKPY